MTKTEHQITPSSSGYTPQSAEEEIQLKELFLIVWRGKWWVIGITILFAISSIAIALSIPNKYKASAIVTSSANQGGGKLASLAGQFGGLASLAGINLSGGELDESAIAMKVMATWGFAEDFVSKYQLTVPLFAAKGWDKSTNQLIINQKIYDAKNKQWVRIPPKGKTSNPTSWELYKKFDNHISINKAKESGFITISATHYSPYIAKDWVDKLINDINLYMRNEALKDANKSIKYLESQIKETSIAEIRTVFAQLIQEQHKTKMLAQISDQYVFKTISAAKIPEEKDSPKRAYIVILGTLLGGILTAFIILVLSVTRVKKDKK